MRQFKLCFLAFSFFFTQFVASAANAGSRLLRKFRGKILNKKLLLGFLLPIFTSGQANAIIIEGEFGGFITEIADRGKYDDEYTTFWRHVEIGDAIHGTYWYDTALAPTPTKSWNRNQLQYSKRGIDTPVWSGMTAIVDGRVFDTTQDQPESELWKLRDVRQVVQITDEANTGYGLADGFSMINSISWVTADSRFSSTVLLFSVWQEQVELFSSTELGQEFSWFDENANPSYNGGLIAKGGYNDNGHYDSVVYFTATYATARIRKATEVDEPGLWLLMLMGISGIALRRIRKTT